jgi:hypothetical protein
MGKLCCGVVVCVVRNGPLVVTTRSRLFLPLLTFIFFLSISFKRQRIRLELLQTFQKMVCRFSSGALLAAILPHSTWGPPRYTKQGTGSDFFILSLASHVMETVTALMTLHNKRRLQPDAR